MQDASDMQDLQEDRTRAPWSFRSSTFSRSLISLSMASTGLVHPDVPLWHPSVDHARPRRIAARANKYSRLTQISRQVARPSNDDPSKRGTKYTMLSTHHMQTLRVQHFEAKTS